VSPADAERLSDPEPDWKAEFLAVQRPRLNWPPEMIQDEAFENTLEAWRRWHYVWREDGQRYRASEADGVIARARLGIMPPRSLEPDDARRAEIPCKELQHDAHCWLTFKGSAWKIRAIEDKTLLLWRGWRPHVEYDSIELNSYTPMQWSRYCDKAVQLLLAALDSGEGGDQNSVPHATA